MTTSIDADRHLLPARGHTRVASAILLSMVIVVILAGMSVSLTTLAVARFGEQSARQDEVELLAAAETAANETIDWLHAYSDQTLKVMTETPTASVGYPNNTVSSKPNFGPWVWPQMLDSDNMPAALAALPAILPAISDGSATYATSTTYQYRQGYRNNCKVSVRVICARQSVGGVTKWPDGNEKYIIYATATAGDLTVTADKYRRLRVEAVVGTSKDQIFTRAMYARNAYDVGGSAGTDSYRGPGAYVAPPSTSPNYGHGDVASGGTVTISGSGSILGAVTNNVKLQLPVLQYTPVPAASSGALAGDLTVVGGNSYHYTSVNMGNSDYITVTGAGVATLYVDTFFKTKHIVYAAGSTAKLVIKQNDYTPVATDTEFDLNGGAIVGDLNDTSRLVFMSNYTGAMKLNGNGQFSGVIYAPFVDISMNGTFQLYGSVIAEGFDGKVNGTFNFHYDMSLASLSLGIPPLLSAAGWNTRPLSVGQP
ncbi:MAG: hypothetical protein H0V44_14305 [Planctomycetes bacterium]|nr:hypothetical protein [Planctomycetota bacterium]